MSNNNPIRKSLGFRIIQNLGFMALITALICLALWFSMSFYTRHGESVDVPNVKGMMMNDATYALSKADLKTTIADSSYNRELPPGTVLEQTPAAGATVKPGRDIYLTINARQTPTLAIPDIADNCSRREAEAKLKALGFKLGNVEYAPGDPDWVIAIKCRGKNVYYGDQVPIDAPIVLVVGNSKDNIVDDFESNDEAWNENELVPEGDDELHETPDDGEEVEIEL